ncbi:endonuclease/exonuclease/phosphatase family protein [Lacipirellula sp.]|uniref:endonuclease/exonuclease/phosphatase family protein n=1 Tax=Lacipirellula sp. TaxID=2691419 RepID=UPI003D0FC1A8
MLAALTILAIASTANAGEPLKAMTFNIRLATGDDGENVWSKRSDLAIGVIRDEKPHVFGVQEAQPIQIEELNAALPEYINVGVGRRADGSDEFSAVYFRRNRFHLSDAGTFWLSDEPTVPGSRSWGNNLPRIATWVRLLDQANKRRIIVLNTHWDHESQPARLNSAKLICEQLKKISGDDEPVIVTGDFNATPENPAMAALIEQGGLRDTLSVAHPKEKNTGTFHGFGRVEKGPKIDAILVSPQWKVKDATIIRTHDGNRYPSDHYPVTATLELP